MGAWIQGGRGGGGFCLRVDGSITGGLIGLGGGGGGLNAAVYGIP